MYMIPEIIEEDDSVGIPIYGTDIYCWIEWKEDENKDQALSRSYGEENYEHAYVYTNFKIIPIDIDPELQYCENKDYRYIMNNFNLFIYKVTCHKTNRKYFMIALHEIIEFGCMRDTVCVPHNEWNLLKFYSEYLGVLGQTKYRLE